MIPVKLPHDRGRVYYDDQLKLHRLTFKLDQSVSPQLNLPHSQTLPTKVYIWIYRPVSAGSPSKENDDLRNDDGYCLLMFQTGKKKTRGGTTRGLGHLLSPARLPRPSAYGSSTSTSLGNTSNSAAITDEDTLFFELVVFEALFSMLLLRCLLQTVVLVNIFNSSAWFSRGCSCTHGDNACIVQAFAGVTQMQKQKIKH